MNNNRGSNRRRGRGGNRQQGNQPQNRIDSRARGNAPQLLEKYKKLAHDSHLNGDRVQEEYYLQFADHYFRVIADQKQRQEEARAQRRDDRDQDDGGRGRDRDASSERDSEDHAEYRGRNRDDSGQDSSDDRSVYEPEDNPFMRGNRQDRDARPRKQRRNPRDDNADGDGTNDDEDEDTGLDPSALPPSIASEPDEPERPAAKPRRRTRKAEPPADDTGDAVRAVN